MMVAYCKAKSVSTNNIMKPDYMDRIMRKYGFQDWDSVLAAVGHGGLKEGQIINKMQEMYELDHQKSLSDEEVMANINAAAAATQGTQQRMRSKGQSAIVVKGIHDVAVRFSKCCSPVPGDEIVGFVTRGRGVSIHRTDCVNIINLPEIDRVRLIDAEWQAAPASEEKFVADIVIYATDRNGLLADVSRALTEKNINIISVNTRTSKTGRVTMETTFEIKSREELGRIVDKLRMIDSVVDIERTSG